VLDWPHDSENLSCSDCVRCRTDLTWTMSYVMNAWQSARIELRLVDFLRSDFMTIDMDKVEASVAASTPAGRGSHEYQKLGYGSSL